MAERDDTAPPDAALIVCAGKVAFDDPKLASIAAKRRPRRHIYRCPFCRHWHVASDRPKGKAKRKGRARGRHGA